MAVEAVRSPVDRISGWRSGREVFSRSLRTREADGLEHMGEPEEVMLTNERRDLAAHQGLPREGEGAQRGTV